MDNQHNDDIKKDWWEGDGGENGPTFRHENAGASGVGFGAIAVVDAGAVYAVVGAIVVVFVVDIVTRHRGNDS